MANVVAVFRGWAKALKRQVLVIHCIGRDPRTPLAAKVIAVLVAAYAFSPIDLIPDFIPVLGLLDDLVIVPLGVLLVMRLVQDAVVRDARDAAEAMVDRPVSRWMVVAIIAAWCIALAASVTWAMRVWRP